MATDIRDFVHLHTHSHYSLLQAVPNIPDLVASAAADGQKSLALTDAGSMYGAVEFYQEARKNNIKPIIGVDFYVAPRSRTNRELDDDKRFYRLVLLAKNTNGYKDLMRLTSEGFLTGFHEHPRIDHELIAKYSKDLIAILPAKTGEVAWHLQHSGPDKAKESLHFYQSVFPADDLYQEITIHPEINGHNELQRSVYTFAKDNNLSLVAANDVYYLKPEDREVRRVAETIGQGYYQLEAAEENYSFLNFFF